MTKLSLKYLETCVKFFSVSSFFALISIIVLSINKLQESSKWIQETNLQFVMTPPIGSPLKSNSMSMYFPWEKEGKNILNDLL